MEEWKVYPYKSRNTKLLEVSDQGRVKLNGILKVFDESSRNYYNACGFNVHRMVAELFVPNPDNKQEVDHINTNKHDNRAVNLRWVTHKENMNNNITNKLMTKINREISKRPEAKEKNRNAHLGIKDSEETRHKKSEAVKLRHKNGLTEILIKANTGKSRTKETRDLLSQQKRNRRHMSNGIDHVFIKPEEIDYYLSLGYHFGTK